MPIIRQGKYKMPQGDGTGPAGQGSMTGRAMGFCAGFNSPGFMNPGFGRGRGLGRGMGRGRGFAWRARAMQVIPMQQVQSTAITKDQEKQFLEQDLDALKKEMEDVQKRLKELK
jgi:hypothetical protein